MKCSSCGAKVRGGAKYCTNCGADLSQQVVQSDPAQVQTPTASMEVPVVSNDAAPLQKRNTQRTVAIACSVLIALVIVVVGGLFLWKMLTPKELLLDADTVKDEALRNTLTVKYDKDGDGKLSEEELGEVKDLEFDSGNDYNFIYLFRNLTIVNVKNPDVTSLDFSKNTNLRSADFTNASNITDIKLPNMPTYDEVKLPDRNDVNVTFPNNSDYEVKYVPKKVEETRTLNGKETNATYEQSVENAYKVSDLKVVQDSSTTTYNFVYGSDGRIQQTKSQYGSVKSTQSLTYDDNNKLINETFSGKSKSEKYPIEYNSQDLVAKVKDDTVSYNGNQIEVGTSGGSVTYRWKTEGERTSSFIEHVGNNSYYTSHVYDADDGFHSSRETIESYCVKSTDGGVTTPDGERYNSQEAPSSMNAKVTYSYENGRLAKATFDNGFEQNYSYDSKGNLTSITSSGSSALNYAQVATTCSIEYSSVIAKKGQTPLTFIVVPGVDKRGVVNLSTNTRQIAVSSGFETAGFAGKFWWDEENIINNQVEAAKAKSEINKEASESLGNVEAESHSMIVSVPRDPYFYQEERQDATWEYNLLTNPNNVTSINKINSAIQDAMDKSAQKAESTPYGKDAGGALLSRNIKVSYINEEIVCFLDSYFYNGWGPHGFTFTASEFFDLRTGERTDAASCIGETQDQLLSDIKQAVTANLTIRPSDIYTTDKVVNAVTLEPEDPESVFMDDASKVAFTETGVLYYMGAQYEMGSYSSGIRSVVVKSDNPSDVGKELRDLKN